MNHVHEFVIPVEWKNIGFDWIYKGDGSGPKPVFSGASVTKLACACGEEKDRGQA